MKGERLLSCLIAVFVSFCLGLGGAACMVTGLGAEASLFWMVLGCGLGAGIASICFCFKRGGWVLLGAGALWLLFQLRYGELLYEFQSLCNIALTYYSNAYGISIPEWAEGAESASQLLPLLTIAGGVMAMSAWTVVRRKPTSLTILIALLPLGSCLVVTDTVPEIWAVFLLLLGVVILLMTQSVRRRDPVQGNRLTLLLTLPVTAALVLLFCLVPREDYLIPDPDNSLQAVLDWFMDRIEGVEKPFDGDLWTNVGGGHSEEVDLSSIGNKTHFNTPVMEVTADYSGTVYLRGRDYDRYDGRYWEAIVDREETFEVEEEWLAPQGTLTIKTKAKRQEYYIPYYPAEGRVFLGGRAENPDLETEYTLEAVTLKSAWKNKWTQDWFDRYRNELIYGDSQLAFPVSCFRAGQDNRYLDLPAETRQRAMALLCDIIPTFKGGTPSAVAQDIGDYVEHSAVYDLKTDPMPEGETDFAMWFLESSDRGYCVHFASATVVLLRAAGIPARYVEGYTVAVKEGETATVRDRMAHAWAEYYLEGVGWVVLDATPSSSEPTETTVPTTEPTTRPTESAPLPTETTRPTNPEQPTESIGGTESTSGASTGATGVQQGTEGTGTDSTGTGGTAEAFRLPDWFIGVLWGLAATAILTVVAVAQWALRRKEKLWRMYGNKPNIQALTRYREARRVARISGLPLPRELTALAEKAKFSQHTLTAEELSEFDAFLRDCVKILRKKPWYLRLIYRIVYAVY